MNEDEFLDIIAPFCDKIIRLEEVENPLLKNVTDSAQKNLDEFFKQVHSNLKKCKSDEEKDFVYITTSTFLIASIKKILREQYKNKTIDYKGLLNIADHLYNGIINIKNEN
jgi:uncharacterized protein YajQ (UPF0234 family)